MTTAAMEATGPFPSSRYRSRLEIGQSSKMNIDPEHSRPHTVLRGVPISEGCFLLWKFDLRTIAHVGQLQRSAYRICPERCPFHKAEPSAAARRIILLEPSEI
jgi:hypothetical protein